MAYMGYTENRESRFLSSRYAYLSGNAIRVEARINNVFTVVRNSIGKKVEKQDCDDKCQKKQQNDRRKESIRVLEQNYLGLEAKKLKKLKRLVSKDNDTSSSQALTKKDQNRITFEIDGFTIPAITSILLGELDSNNRFDDILLFDSNEETIYQKYPQRGRIGNLSDLQTSVNPENDEIVKQVLTDNISNMVRYFQQVEYLVFEAPVKIKTQPDSKSWKMVALIARDKLVSDKLEFPTTELVGFVSLLTLLILSWPFLRIRYFGPYDTVYRHDLWIQVVSGCIAVALITVVTLQIRHSNQFFSRLDLESWKIGIELKEAFTDELRAQVTALQAAREELVNTYNTVPRTCSARADAELEGDALAAKKSACADKRPDFLEGKPGDYPYPLLKMLYLMDQHGDQLVKWSAHRKVTRPGNFADRVYFQRALPKNEKSLYAFENNSENGPKFFFDVIKSRTTGEQSVVISMPAECQDKNGNPGSPCVIVMSSEMWSMESTVPFGFGYAVVDKTGAVLFHSGQDSSKQLFEEVDDPNQLIVAVDVGYGQIEAKYQGSDHRFSVQSIGVEGAGWNLVTFYNKDLYELFLLETAGATTAAWAVLFGIFLIITGLYMVVTYMLGRERVVSWLNRISFRSLSVLLLVTILITVFWPIEFGLLACILFIPVLLLGIRQMTRNLREVAFLSADMRLVCLVAAMLAFMLAITVLPVAKFHSYSRDIAFSFIVNAQHMQQSLRRDIRMENEAVWQAKTMAKPEHRKTASKFRKTFIPFPGDIRPPDKLDPIECQRPQGLIFAWLCKRMSKLPIYSAEALRIRPAYHLDLMDEDMFKATTEGFYDPKRIDPERFKEIPAQIYQPAGATQKVLDALFVLLLIALLAVFIWRWSTKLMGLKISNLAKGASLRAPLPGSRLHQIVYGMAERSRWVFLEFVGVERLFMLDFRRVTVHSSIVELLQGAKDTHDVVVVDHFDELIKDPELVKLRVELLEFLLHETNVSIFVITSMDVLSYLNQRLIVDQDLDSKLVARLAIVLSYFSRHYYEEEPPEKTGDEATAPRRLLYEECFHPNLQDIRHQVEQDPLLDGYAEQQIINLVLARARAIYQVMWDVCSHVEKFTLIQLAHDRPVNPNNWEVAQKLKQRGFLRRDPNYRIFNKSFEWFIQSVEPVEDLVAWQSEVTSTWDRIRIPVLVLVLFGLAFLAITQPGFFNSLFAWVAAAGAALPIALRFFGTWWASRAVGDAGSK